ncbi:MAG: NAD-dependent dehydratase [Flavobacteriales bacterium]|nr:NAD-dependent dehydratase [Flavobacteriales bacterium]
MSRSLLVAGPTGLIGSTVLKLALVDDRFSRVIALTRRPLGTHHPKLEEWRHEELLQALRPERLDAVVCCLGTTIRKVGGDKAKFVHVDKDLVVGLGRWAKSQGIPVLGVVSAIGADPRSRVFYNRVKGEMEAELKALELPALHLFQPSILTGPRQEHRAGERIGIALGRLFAPLLPARYKPMPHDVLAQALLNATHLDQGGTHTYQEILALAGDQKLTKRS